MQGSSRRTAALRWLVALLAALQSSPHAMSVRLARVRVLAAGAVQAAVRQLEPAFAPPADTSSIATYDTVGALRDRVLAGEAADVVILSEAGMAALAKAGKIDAGALIGSRQHHGCAGGAQGCCGARRQLVARGAEGAPCWRRPRSRTPIRRAGPRRGRISPSVLRAARHRASSCAPRVTVLGFGGDVIAGVAEGRFEIGVSQSSEIVAHPGVVLAGRLPEPYAHRTRYRAAKVTGAGPSADAFLALLTGPQGRAALQAIGFGPR